MKLVLTYSDGDGYTYWCPVVLPFEAESKEDAEARLAERTKTKASAECRLFDFFGHKLSLHRLHEIDFEGDYRIWELDEWWVNGINEAAMQAAAHDVGQAKRP